MSIRGDSNNEKIKKIGKKISWNINIHDYFQIVSISLFVIINLGVKETEIFNFFMEQNVYRTNILSIILDVIIINTE